METRLPAEQQSVQTRTDVSAETSEIKVIGLRRLIAERMSEAKRTIPHFAYVEEVDVTELESLRQHLNLSRPPDAASLSFLPLVVMALTRVLESFPQCNVLYDAARGVLVRYRPVHVGIATQTPDGLKVPVVRYAQSLGLWEIAAEIRRLAERARSNKATREELAGSTITVTSLGKLGGIVSTPIINAPEVAIIGLNKAVERPVVHQGAVTVRRIMNLSSSFDHRFVDGYDAAAMIQALKELLEHPATIFYTQGEIQMTSQPQRPAFGTLLTSHMAVATYQGGAWSRSEIKPVAPLELSPAAHVLHYASSCFEGFQGIPPRRRIHTYLSHGSAYSANAAKRAAIGVARTGCRAARRHGACRDQSLP